MIVAAALMAIALWAGAWGIVSFLRGEHDQSRLPLILFWSIIPTWLSVENNMFQPYLMAAIMVPTLLLMAKHARGQAMIRARVAQKSRQPRKR